MILLLGIIGVIISTAVGTIWYSPKTPMGKIHMESLGFTKLSAEEQGKRIAEMKPKMWKYYGAQMLLSLLTSLFIAFIMQQQKAFGSEIIYGEVGFIWLCFTIPMVGQALLWGNCDHNLRWKKFFSDAIENLITYCAIVFVFSFIV